MTTDTRQSTAKRPSLIGRSTATATPIPTLAVVSANRDEFCPECGQPLTGPRVSPRPVAQSPWWSWLLIAVGATLVGLNGLAVGRAMRELVVSREVLQRLAAWESGPEGPSVQQAMLREQGPPGVEDRYLAALRELDRSLPRLEFGLALVVLGISAASRRRIENGVTWRSLAAKADETSAFLDSMRRGLLGVWESAEFVTLSATCLIGVDFAYLLAVHLLEGQPPTLEMVQESLERVLQTVGKAAQLIG